MVLINLKKQIKWKKKFANLGTMLSRAQAKKIVGGFVDDDGASEGYTCFAQVNGHVNAYYNGNSLSEAASSARGAATGHWCCRSCSRATWLRGIVEF